MQGVQISAGTVQAWSEGVIAVCALIGAAVFIGGKLRGGEEVERRLSVAEDNNLLSKDIERRMALLEEGHIQTTKILGKVATSIALLNRTIRGLEQFMHRCPVCMESNKDVMLRRRTDVTMPEGFELPILDALGESSEIEDLFD